MSGTELKIKVIGDSFLRKKSRKVGRVTAELADFLSKMARFMYDSKGIGLAAPQVGLGSRMIVCDIGTGLYKLINPRITGKSGSQVNEEGCLSCPGIYIKVRRARNIRVEALDESGKPLKIEARDLLACVIQHEIDHLDGKLIVDYASLLKKMSIKKRLKELADEKLPEPNVQHSKL